jgi:hypothetical protein
MRNNPQVVGEIRAKKTHTTHMNTMKLISFWCSKLGCIFWLYSLQEEQKFSSAL